MADLLVLAFQADLTRVATFVFANEGSNRSYRDYRRAGGPSRPVAPRRQQGRSRPRSRRSTASTSSSSPTCSASSRSIKEGDGTLLDNCMIVYGSGISDGNRHNHDDLPILLAGKGGGTLKTGRHLRYPRETPLTNLYLSMLDRMGVHVDSFGDSTGRLKGLEG